MADLLSPQSHTNWHSSRFKKCSAGWVFPSLIVLPHLSQRGAWIIDDVDREWLWGWDMSCSHLVVQAGALQNSQPPTPYQTLRPVMVNCLPSGKL
jgi:hypothetical protein